MRSVPSPNADRRPENDSDIAVVGLGIRLPGGIRDLGALWDLLAGGGDTVRPVPGDRWDERFFDDDPTRAGTTYCRVGSFLDDIDRFDADFFGISPREARAMDPQQRLLLEVAWEAMEDAGHPREWWAGSRTGVYVGLLAPDYTVLHAKTSGVDGIDPYYATGKEFSFAAGRLNYLFDLTGPALTVTTACSSSLVATHLACVSLRGHESDVALAAGVNLMLTPELSVFMSKVQAMSPTGSCKPFDASADGVVRGEGCVVAVLKRLADARADGNRIYAVLRGSAVNHDGHSAGLTVPNAGAQQKVIRQAIEAAGVDAADVAYVEAHGTGTPLGDPIEISALAETYGVARADRSPLVVGSHKANFGHLDSAAGITGLLKAILVARHRAVPPQPRLGTLNPMVDWDRTHIALPTELTPLPDDAGDLVAVSAFGLSGTNAHIILAAAPADVANDADADDTERSHVVALSAHDEDLLPALAGQLAGTSASVADLAHTTTAHRTAHEHRAAVVASDVDELRAALDALASGEESPDVVTGSVEDRDPPSVVFAFSGQGSQWAGMAISLYESEPIVRATLDEIDELIRRDASWSLLETLRATDDRLRATELAQPAIFAVQLAVARLWESWGVRPAAVVGHSMGEIAAACFAGGLDVADATRLIVARGRLMQAATGTGRMAAVTATQDEIRPLLDAAGPDVCVATVNGPRSLVVAGTAEAVTAVAKACDGAGLRCVPLPVDYAFHSPLVRQYGDELEELLGDLRPSQPHVRLLSSVTPDREPTLDARYWGDNVREPVLLWPAVDAYLAATPDTADVAFVEIGAHPVLVRPLADALATREHPGFAVPSLQRGTPGHRSMARSLARLHVAGVAVDWATRAPGRQVALPPYPWGGDRYWLTGVERGEQGGPASAPRKLRAVVSVYDEKDRLVATVDDARLRPAEAEAPTPAVAASSAVGVAAAPAAERSAPNRPSAQPTPAVETGAPAGGRRSGATAVRAAVEAVVSEVLGRESRRSLPNRRSLFELGLDSLSAVEVGRRVGERFGMDLPRTVVFDHPTLEALSSYLVDNGAAVDATPVADETAGTETAATEDTPSAPAVDGRRANEPIAVVGLACRFPGAPDADAYWDLLASGRNAIRDIPRERFDADALLGSGEPGTIATTRGGFLDDVSGFDAGFFRVSPREARAMDPQQRLLMEVAWEAIEDAGLPQDALRDTPTGVYVGLNTADYQQLLTRVDENVDLYYGTGNCFSGAAGRLSYFLGLRGPSIAVDTACSSALTATHLACQALRAGECDVAIAGGANTIVAPTVYLAMSAGGALAPDGQCKTFDEAADGYARGEGAGVLVLKPLSKALADGDRVHAVIRGSAVNQDGASGGLTVPSGPAQVDVIRAALRNAGTSADEVDYVEAHGTGTALGDPIEIQSLAAALGEGRDDTPVLVGSVKTNVGHLEAAAGVASLVKVVLSLRNELLPAHLNLTKPSSRIDWDRLPVRVVTEPTPWPRGERPRVAGVSGFGFTGTNAHVILAEAPQQERATVDADALDRGVAVPLSAASEPALRALAGAVAERIAAAGDDPATLVGIARTAALHRTHLEHRAVASGTTADDLAAALRAVAAGHRHPGAVTGRAPGAERRGLALVVGDPATVLGGDWMRLAQQDSTFSAAVDEWDALVRARLGWSVRDALGGPRGGDRAHVLALATQVALGQALAARGALPDVVVGTPGGHLAAAVLAGAITAEEALTELTTGTVASRRASDVELVEHAVPVFEACASPESVAELLGATLPAGGDVALVLGAGLPVGEPMPVETDAGDGVLLALAGAAKDGVAGLLRDVAALHAYGCAVDWAAALPAATPVELPHYPWQRSSYWFERVAPSGDRAASSAQDVESGAAAAGALLAAAATGLGASRLVLRDVRVAAGDAVDASCDSATGDVRLLGGGREVAGAVARVAEPRPAPDADGDAVELAGAGTPADALAAIARALDAADLTAAAELYADLDVTPSRAFVSRAADGAPADVVAVDGDGRVALALTGAVLVAAGRPIAEDVRERVADRAYRWDWVEIDRPDGAPVETVAVCGDADLAGSLADALAVAGVADVQRADLTETDPAALAARLPDGAAVAYAATGDSVERAANELRALAAALAETGRGRLWIVTAGAEATRGRRPEPGAAALTALGRVLAAEYPETWGGLVDDDPLAERPGAAAAAAVAAAPAGGDAREDRICVRGTTWYAARLVAAGDAVPEVAVAPAVEAEAWCVVTGGADASGAPYARWLVDHGARRLLVTGSGDGVPGLVADVEIRVVADDADALRAALADLDGPIAAVIHAPADPPVTAIGETPADALGADLRRARIADVLDGATRADPPALFVLTCSAAPLWGSLGTANRALAAGWTAAVAERRAGAGLPAQVVETMPRDDTGELADRDRTMMAGAGLEPLTADDVVEGLDALASGTGRVTLAKVARDVFARRSAERLPRAELALLAGAPDGTGAAGGGDTPLVAELRATLPDDRLDLLVERVCAATAEALGRAPGDEVDPGQGFFELGMDSVMSLALKTRLENETGLSLPNTLTFESPNSRALARYLLTEELAGVLDAEPAAEATGATDAVEPAEPAEPVGAAADGAAEAGDENDDDLLARLDDALSTSSMLLNEEGAA